MSRKVHRANSRISIIIASAMVATFASASIANSAASIQMDGDRIGTLFTSPDIDSTWRHTKNGWQDSASWPAADPFVPVKTIELIHPFVWAGIVLIAVIGMTVWASNEWEIARLFESNEDTCGDHQ